MKRFARYWPYLLGILIVGGAAVHAAIEKKDSGGAYSTEAMTGAASGFIASLSEEARTKCVFAFDADERLNWHYIPKRDRKGIPFREMNADQRKLAEGLMTASLSATGYQKAKTIMSFEPLVAQVDQKSGNVAMNGMRDPGLYYFKFFGEPKAKGTWGWSVEGHHVSLNFTVVDGKATSTTPAFFGAQPHEVMEGERKGLRVLGEEEDGARALVAALDEAQKTKAVGADAAPGDIFSKNSRHAMIEGAPQGLASGEIRDEQKKLLQKLINTYISNLPEDLAADRRARVAKADPATMYFLWLGDTAKAPGKGYYYRVQASTFLIEFDNTANNATHSHSVWRDYEDDFGYDLLATHHAEVHGDVAP